MTSPHPARFGRARRRARPSARRRRRLPSTCWAAAAAPSLNSSEAARGCALSKDRARTGHSQKIVPGLEASNQVRDVKPGPERSEGPASNQVRDVKPGPERSEGPAYNIGRKCKREPERSEGAPSQKIGRELEAYNIGRKCKREPERSEGSGAKFPELFSFFWYTLERNLV